VDYAALLKQGIILDVRSPAEYKQGHIKGSINAPLNELSKHISKLKRDCGYLVVHQECEVHQQGVLKSNGFTQVYNGGGWVAYKTKYNERTNFIK
jgi:rhodanese-related sulfurtransferase